MERTVLPRYLKFQLDIDQKIILSSHQNNYVKRFDDNVAKSFNILTTSLNVLHNYFENSNKIIFRFISSKLKILNFLILQQSSFHIRDNIFIFTLIIIKSS